MAEDSRFACKYTDEESEGEMEKNWKMFDIQWNNICSGTYKMCNDIIVYMYGIYTKSSTHQHRFIAV